MIYFLVFFGLALNTVVGYAVTVCIDDKDSSFMNHIDRACPHFTWLIAFNLWPIFLGFYAWNRFMEDK